MAWLAVDKNGEEYLYLKKPERYSHHNVFNHKKIDYEIWASNGDNLKLQKGSIKELLGYELTWDDKPVEI